MDRRAHVPVKVMLFAISAGNVLLEKGGGVLKLPETWMLEGETICRAADRLAKSIVRDTAAVKPVAVIWFTEARSPEYHLVFAVEVFMDSEVRDEYRNRYVMLHISDAVKLVDDEMHRSFLNVVYTFKPRPLLVCSPF